MLLTSSLRRIILAALTKLPLERQLRLLIHWMKNLTRITDDKLAAQIIASTVKADSNCVDVGAYRGDILHHLVKHSPKGQIFAIEPIPGNAEYLKKTFPRATVLNIAASDKAGTQDFFFVHNRPARSGLTRQSYPDEQNEVETIKVQTCPLDEVIPSSIPITLIKIDTEGTEQDVLTGARQILSSYQPIIIFEHTRQMARTHGVDSEELYRLLRTEHRYRIKTLKSWDNSDSTHCLSCKEFVDLADSEKAINFIAEPEWKI